MNAIIGYRINKQNIYYEKVNVSIKYMKKNIGYKAQVKFL